MLQGFSDQAPDALRGRDFTFGEPAKKAPALCYPDRGTNDCFGRKSMNLAIVNAEDIAPQMERADLPTTVGEKFVCPNCALAYPVDVIRRLCFSKYFRTLAIFILAPNGTLIGKFS